MAVEGVSNSNNNAGLYALGAATIGAGAGGVIGHTTKSILKDGNYSDEFIKQMMKSEEIEVAEKLFKLDTKSDTYLKDCIDLIKKHAKLLGIDPKEVSSADVNIATMFGGNEKLAEYMENVKVNIAMNTGEIITTGKDSNISDILKKHLPDDMDEVFDRTSKEFKKGMENANISKAMQKAIRNLKLRTAGIYGAIAAGVLGIGTYLATMGGKSSAPEQKVDAQA